MNHAYWNILGNIEKKKVGRRKPLFYCVKPASPLFNLRATLTADGGGKEDLR